MSKEWRVPVEWCAFGVLRVEADTLEEAVLKVHNNPDDYPLPDDDSYIEGTFKVSVYHEDLPVYGDENISCIRESYNY